MGRNNKAPTPSQLPSLPRLESLQSNTTDIGYGQSHQSSSELKARKIDVATDVNHTCTATKELAARTQIIEKQKRIGVLDTMTTPPRPARSSGRLSPHHSTQTNEAPKKYPSSPQKLNHHQQQQLQHKNSNQSHAPAHLHTYPTIGIAVGAEYGYDDANSYGYVQTQQYPSFVPPYPVTTGHYPLEHCSPPHSHPVIVHQYIPVAVPVSIVHHYVHKPSKALQEGDSPGVHKRHRNVSSPIKKVPSHVEDRSQSENMSCSPTPFSSISSCVESTNSMDHDETSGVEGYPSRIVSPSGSPKRRRKRGRRKKRSQPMAISELCSFHEDDLPKGLIGGMNKIELYDSDNEKTQTSTPAASTNDDTLVYE